MFGRIKSYCFIDLIVFNESFSTSNASLSLVRPVACLLLIINSSGSTDTLKSSKGIFIACFLTSAYSPNPCTWVTMGGGRCAIIKQKWINVYKKQQTTCNKRHTFLSNNISSQLHSNNGRIHQIAAAATWFRRGIVQRRKDRERR